jgi:hypothetical protein
MLMMVMMMMTMMTMIPSSTSGRQHCDGQPSRSSKYKLSHSP